MQTKLSFSRQGEGGCKVIFVHGNTGSARWWRPAMERLRHKCDMVAVDLRGFGNSPDPAGPVTIPGHAEDIQELASNLGFDNFIIVGHSLGGAVAMQIAASYPELLKGMVLVDAAPLTGIKNVDYNFLEQAIRQNLMVAGLKATMAVSLDEAYFAELAEDCVRSLPAVIPNTRALEAIDFTAVAGQFTKPVLVVQGEKDTLIPTSEAEKTADAYPQAKLVVIRGAGHSPQVEKSEAFAEQLKAFLAETDC